MRKGFSVGLMSFALTLSLGISAPPVSARVPKETAPVDAIREKLLRVPYYGVFDFLAFHFEDGVVTLKGYAYQPGLKVAAEHAVRQVPGVRDVVDDIEVLPVSNGDDDLRWKIYYALYGDSFLSRYAPAGGQLWGHRHSVPFGFFRSTTFPGLEPLGEYPIAIIVKDGHVTLMGVVDREADKDFAGLKAKGVFGSFSVDNLLEVDPGH